MHALSHRVYQNTDGSFFPCRFWRAAKVLTREYGWPAGIGFGIGGLTASVGAIGLAYFCMEGVVRSCMLAAEQAEPLLTRIRPLGDAGGWLSLVFFSIIALKAILEAAVREGEYVLIKELCPQNHRLDLEDPNWEEKYSEICTLLDAFNSRALFTRSLAARRLSALALFPLEAGTGDTHLALDLRLQKALTNIQVKLNGGNPLYQHADRLQAGYKSIRKLNNWSYSIALIFSTVLPLIFVGNAFLSIIGEVGLGKDIFYNRTGLEETGHFGEWPINACEALSVAWLLHLWYLVNEGHYFLARKAYRQEIKQENDDQLILRLADLANRELSEISQICHHMKYPFQYISRKP